MSYLLHSKKISYKIYTIDVIPNNKKIYWNCITDLRYGKITRNELLKWEGFSDKQAKDLGYKNPLKMKTEFLQILKNLGIILK